MEVCSLDIENFLVSLSHKKYKLIELVKKQIEDLKERKYYPCSMSENVHYFQRMKEENETALEHKNIIVNPNLTMEIAEQENSKILMRSARCLCIGTKTRLVAAVICILFLLWLSVIYGALLGANYCSGRQSCIPYRIFGHSTKRNIIF